VAIFVTPPSRAELIKRLSGRGSEDEQSFALRLMNAEAEMARAGEYDYLVVNDTVAEAVARLKAIRMAEHCRQHRI
jgi:guanylate kinase